MPLTDAKLIRELTQDTCHYLDRLERKDLLWTDVEGHIAASHLAEILGDAHLVACHLQTVNRLLAELYL